MIWIFDLILVSGVSILFGTRFLFLGIMIFVAGLFFLFQAHRTRLLLGGAPKEIPTARKVRAGLISAVMAAFLLPVLLESESLSSHSDQATRSDSDLPVVVLAGLLSATLMVGLSVEKRKR